MLIPLLYFGISIVIAVMVLAGIVCVASIGPIEVDSYEYQTKTVEWT